MATVKITKRIVDSTKPSIARVRLWDAEVPGFGLEVTPKGHKTYVFKYRIGGGRSGRVRWAKIGDHGPLTPDQARDLARRWSAEVAAGGDPAGDRTARREAPTVADLLDRYLRDHAEPKNKPRTSADVRLIVDGSLKPALGRHKVADVTSDDVARFHSGRAATPYRANRALAVLSKAFTLAELWKMRPKGSNPCRDVERFPEKPRERYLTTEEFARLGQVLVEAELGPVRLPPKIPGGADRARTISRQAVRAIRLLMFTGARLGEVLGLRWEHVDLAAGRANLPDSKTGKKVVQLPGPALDVLAAAERPANGRGFVIRGQDGSDPDIPLVNMKDPWGALRAAADLPELRLHDLRHAFASIAVNDGMSLPLIGALLGHLETKTTQRYAHLADNPQKVAAARVAGQIKEAMTPRRAGGQVVPFKRKT